MQENKGVPASQGGIPNAALACHDCSLPYDDPAWIEAVVPHDVWNKHLSPSGNEGGILCIGCMAQRAVRAGLSNVPVMLTAGPFLLCRPSPTGRGEGLKPPSSLSSNLRGGTTVSDRDGRRMAETEGLGAKPGQPGPEGHRPDTVALPEDDEKLIYQLAGFKNIQRSPEAYALIGDTIARIETLFQEIERLESVVDELTTGIREREARARAEIKAAAEAAASHELQNCVRRQRERPVDSRAHATAGASAVAILHNIRSLTTGSAAGEDT